MERWDDLRLFLAVARQGTLTAAAEALGVNASTLHRHLGRLEDELGTTIFEKGPRGYRLTAVGEALMPRAEEVEEAIYAAGRTVRGHDNAVSGEVRITMPVDLLPVVGPHLVAFRQTCAGVRPVVLAEDAVLDLGRSADVALRPSQHPPDTAVGRKLLELAWCRYAPVHCKSDDLPWLHFVGLDHTPAVAWARRSFDLRAPVMRVDSVTAMHTLLRATRAQGLLPCFVGDPDPSLRRVGQPAPEASSTLWLLIHADLRRAARVRALIDGVVPRLLAERALFEGRAGGSGQALS